MQTVTVEITHDKALQTLQNMATKKKIRIIEKSEFNIPALPGHTLSLQEFRQWIANAENTPTISLQDARSAWTARKKQLQRIAAR
jgi:hypothetical protein